MKMKKKGEKKKRVEATGPGYGSLVDDNDKGDGWDEDGANING